jgi:hypothetical protein
VAKRPKVWVYGRSLAGNADSNPSGGIDVLSAVGVVFCQVEVSATGRSLDQRSPTEFDLSDCDRQASYRRPRPTKVVEPGEETSSTHLTRSHIRHIVITDSTDV